jgi:hypothetical protein
MMKRSLTFVTSGSRADIAMLSRADDDADTLYRQIVTLKSSY